MPHAAVCGDVDEVEEAELAGRAVLALYTMPGCPAVIVENSPPGWHAGLLRGLHHHARLDIRLWTGALVLCCYVASTTALMDANPLDLNCAFCLWDEALPDIYRLNHHCLQVSAVGSE